MRKTTRFSSLFAATLTNLLAIALGAVALVALVLVPVVASASQKGPDANVFLDRLQAALSSGTVQKQVLFDREAQANQVTNDQLSLFTLGARRQANIWADTILEGDYEAAGNTEVDRVEAVVQNHEVVAYHITYSEKAWYTGECDQQRDLSACSEGRIVESSYVSPTATTWIEDDSSLATFVSHVAIH